MNTGSAWMNRLQGLIDGELDAAQATEVAAHLAECDACVQAHANAIALRSAMRLEGVRAQAPDRLFERLDAAAGAAATHCQRGPWIGPGSVVAWRMRPQRPRHRF